MWKFFSLIFSVGFSVKNYVRVNRTEIALIFVGALLFPHRCCSANSSPRALTTWLGFAAHHLATSHHKISTFPVGV